MSIPRADFAAVALPSGDVLLIGGQTSATEASATVDLYQPSTNTIKAVAPMKIGRRGESATLLPNGKVLVAGGSAADSGYPLAEAEIYDPVADTWTSTPPMVRARTHHAAVLMRNGKVLVVGGAAEAYPAVWEVYDPVANSWTSVEAFDPRPFGPTATVLNDGEVLVDGGQTGTPPVDSFFDPVKSVFIGTPVPVLSLSRTYATSALTTNGLVITAGGESSASPGGALNSTEIYDPTPSGPGALGTWYPGPAMDVGHSHASMTAVGGGDLLVAGGRAGTSDPIAVCELYDPIARAWSMAAPLLQARGLHVGVTLADGRALVAGGVGQGGGVLATTELYTPA